VVEGAFVPEHRTHRLIDGFRCKSPGNELNASPLFRIPFGQIFVRSVSTTAIGIAEAALEAFTRTAAQRIAAGDQSKVAGDPGVQSVAAEAAAAIDEVKLVLARNVDALMGYAERGEGHAAREAGPFPFRFVERGGPLCEGRGLALHGQRGTRESSSETASCERSWTSTPPALTTPTIPTSRAGTSAVCNSVSRTRTFSSEPFRGRHFERPEAGNGSRPSARLPGVRNRGSGRLGGPRNEGLGAVGRPALRERRLHRSAWTATPRGSSWNPGRLKTSP